MSLYLDASVLVALFVVEPHTERADAQLGRLSTRIVVSDFAAAEFVSTLARRGRTRTLETDAARAAFGTFDTWIAVTAQRTETQPGDIAAADTFLRRLDLTLRAPDAINIAIARRMHALLMTFDAKMAANARVLGLQVASI